MIIEVKDKKYGVYDFFMNRIDDKKYFINITVKIYFSELNNFEEKLNFIISKKEHNLKLLKSHSEYDFVFIQYEGEITL